MADECFYRERPFKKRTAHIAIGGTPRIPQATAASLSVFPVSENASRVSQRYPNPGFLGSSSHTTFFDHLTGSELPNASSDLLEESDNQSCPFQCAATKDKIDQGAAFLVQVRESAQLSAWKFLIEKWTGRGINLPLAEPFTVFCAASAYAAISQCDEGNSHIIEIPQSAVCMSRKLFSQTCKPLQVSADDTIETFRKLFCKEHARWETLGLFFTAVSRASIDVTRCDGLYNSEQERRALRKMSMRFSDICLDIALSLDCLNDLQLILQYENFILHSLVDGDQSYHSWRKLGDVISSLFALGYHEQLGDPFVTPLFLRELRYVAYSRTYSADKNCSIFLGRPPRMLKRYCPISNLPEVWEPDERFSYRADTRVHGVCASLKEDVLDLERTDHTIRSQKADHIRHAVEIGWAEVPTALRLDRRLSTYSLRHVEIDFLVSAKLNFSHVKFLLELTMTPRVSHPGLELLQISADMLSLVVEAIVLKERLANSGTSLVWKVAYYGLAPAGVLCLALLYNTFDRAGDATPSRSIRDLSVLVAEIETGALLQSEDPNYALLFAAARTIKNLLDRLISNGFAPIEERRPLADTTIQELNASSDGDVYSWDTHGLQDFDPEFWVNLSEHPFLITTQRAI